jgi:DNA-binding response OmpR family regulator/two-component sensor histidine kinase
MLKSDVTKEQASRLQLVKQNGQRLLRLVDQLLALSRLEAEEPIERTAQPLSKICGAISDSFASLARTREITFEVRLDDDLWVSASADELEKILMNLLSNAFKYTPRGGLVSINLGLRDGEQVELAISDSGVGIPPERQESVFDRFNRVVDASENVPGAGIGLSLVSEIVEALGGSINLVSALGEGTSMTVRLPGIEAPMPNQEAESDIVLSESSSMELDNLSRSGYVTNVQDNGDEQQKITILVIEDNPDMQQYLVELLSPHYSCLVASDGQMGTEIGLDQVPDLILCDVMLPKQDGYEISQTLKSDERTSHIPIIMLTARGDHVSRLKGLREKVDDYIAKPFDDEELLLRVGNILGAREIIRNKFAEGVFDNDDSGQGFSKRDRVFLAKLDTVLESHLSDTKFRTDVLTSEMAMSERNLQRKLKALTGRTPGQYLRTYRLKKALVLLRDGIPVNSVADRVGFSSPAYFSSCFREEFDQSPSKFSGSEVHTHSG